MFCDGFKFLLSISKVASSKKEGQSFYGFPFIGTLSCSKT